MIVRPIQNVDAFETPNQVTTTVAQAQTALSAILDGVTKNSGLSVIQDGDVPSLDPVEHLELWPAVTDFTLDDTTINRSIRFQQLGHHQCGPTHCDRDQIRYLREREI